MFITLYFIVTRLPDSLRSVRDHFLSLDPTILTIDLLEQQLLAAETSVVAVGAARGTPRTPLLEGCFPTGSLVDPSGGPVVARSSTVLPCPAVQSGSLSGLHLPSFSTNLSRLLVYGLPRSLPPLLPSPAPPCLPCVEGRQRAAPHSSSFPSMTAPLQTLHMDLREQFRTDLPLLRLHSERGGDFSSELLREFGRGEGILQSFTLPDSPQQNGIAERRIGLVMEVARTSVIHALNLWLHVSLPETSPTLRLTGEVGDASVFRVWGSRAFVHDTSADKLAARAIPFVFLGFVPDAPGWQFYHPTLRRVFSSQDVTFDEPGPAPSGAARGTATGGAAFGGAEPGGAETEGAGSWDAEPRGVEPGVAEPTSVEPGGAESEGVEPGGAESEGAESGEPLSLQQLREWLARRTHLWSGAAGAGATEDTGAGGAGVTAGAGGTGGAAPAGPGGAGAGGAGGSSAGGTMRPRPYFVPLLHPASPVRTGCCVPRLRAPPIPSTHAMALCPSSIPLRVPLPAPLESSLPAVPDPESDLARAASPTVSLLLAIHLDFDAACRLDYATTLVAESGSASPPFVGGECALCTDVLEDRQEDIECLAAAVPRFASMLLAHEGDPDAPDIPTPRSYAEAITGTYIDAVPPSRANIVDGMWIFRVKRPPSSPPAFKTRYVARGFNQRQGVDYCHNFSPTPKMTTLWVMLHVVAQHDYELHSLIFSTAFLYGSLHEEIWLRRPPGFTGLFPAVYGLRQAAREWHDTLRTTLAALGFTPSIADSSLSLRTDTSLPPFYVIVYVGDLIFDTAGTEVLQRFGFQFSSPQPTPLSTSHSLSAPPSDESIEPSGLYPELVGCLMYLMTCTRPDLAYPLSLLARYVAPGRHQKVHWDAAKRVLRYLCNTSGMGLVLGGRGLVVLNGHADASWVDDSATQRSSQGYTFSLGSGFFSWRSTRSSSVLSTICEAEIYAEAMAAQELRWLTYLPSDLGEQPRSPPVLYVDNKAIIALCQKHRLEHRTNHIALQYFLARDSQQRGHLHLAHPVPHLNPPSSAPLCTLLLASILPRSLTPCVNATRLTPVLYLRSD
ncbi:unnamed protein product [Closterium sp. NIES-54]